MRKCGKSIWSAEVSNKSEIMKLDGNKKTDVLIIGGGMAGILTAYRLKEAGIKCIVAEAKTIGSGTTGNTTAKITAQHGLIYADICARYGLNKARLHYEANKQAINDFRLLSSRYPCDFEEKNAFVYTVSDRRKIEREANAYAKIGITPRIDENLPLPFPTKGAVVMENQAQFAPLKLLLGLAAELEIYEETFIHRIEGNNAITDNGIINAKCIVLATHYPLINIPGLYFLKLYQHRSYVIALEKAPDLNGMYLEEKKNGLSFRNYGDKLLIGGGDHKTGDHIHGGGYGVIRDLAKSAFPDAVEKYYWAAQDCMSLDGLPYLGEFSMDKPHIYVATGFNKWGMSGAMVAATVIHDLISKGKSKYKFLYSPSRSIFTKQLFVNLGAAVSGLINFGAPRCSHMGCKLNWNRIEMTWDCSCHGSRFDKDGHIIDNPAKRRIRR